MEKSQDYNIRFTQMTPMQHMPLSVYSVPSQELIPTFSHLILTSYPSGGSISKTWEDLIGYMYLDCAFTKGCVENK